MLLLAGLFVAGGVFAFIREDYVLGAGALVLAAASIVFFFILRKKKKQDEAATNTLPEEDIKQEKPNGGKADIDIKSLWKEEAKPEKKPRPDPDCPICHGHGLKAGNFTGDLVNCDCMEEDD